MQNLETITLNNTVYVRADSAPKPAVLDGLKYAIVRSKDQGVMCGFVQSIEGRRVTLLHARQMWRWSSRFVLPDIAEFGLTQKFDRKFSAEMSQPVDMLEACGVLYCTDTAMQSLRTEPSQEPGK
jgi:hypothetical protein